MRKVSPVGLALGAVGLALGVVGVLAMREATLSTHEPAAPGSRTEVVLEARSKGGERGQTLEEMVEAQLLACRLEVTADLVGEIEVHGDGVFRSVLAPGLDETDRRQFKGCLEDWVVDHFRIDVIDLEEVEGPAL